MTLNGLNIESGEQEEHKIHYIVPEQYYGLHSPGLPEALFEGKGENEKKNVYMISMWYSLPPPKPSEDQSHPGQEKEKKSYKCDSRVQKLCVKRVKPKENSLNERGIQFVAWSLSEQGSSVPQVRGLPR